MTPAVPAAAPAPNAPPAPAGGGERIVAVVLATMILVLAWVWFALKKSPSDDPPPPFDVSNPLLDAGVGACVDSEDMSMPGVVARYTVLAPGPVLRPHAGPATIPGYTSVSRPDLREAPPYLACEERSMAVGPRGAPAVATGVRLFDLNGFGMPADTSCALGLIQPATVTWSGQTRRRCYEVLLHRFDQDAGPWHLFLSKDAPVLGIMVRDHLGPQGGLSRVRFQHPPEGCR